MADIPSLSLPQLELLRLAKKHSVEELRLVYEFPVLDDNEPASGHPPFIQELIDHHFIQVQVKETALRASEFQPELGDGFESLRTPGKSLGQFSKVWIREIGLRGVQPSSL